MTTQPADTACTGAPRAEAAAGPEPAARPVTPRHLTLESLRLQPAGDRVDLCHDCGACLSRCHLAEAYPDMNPRKLLHLLRNGWEEEAIAAPFLWVCTLCNRCTDDCPLGIQMEEIVRTLRGLAVEQDLGPAPLVQGIQNRLQIGNVSAVEPGDYVEHAEWMAEELGMEWDDPSIEFPMDRAGARYLYLPNPRELTVNPGLFTANLKILVALKEPFTLSQRAYDVTNWGYFTGQDDKALEMLHPLLDACTELGIDTVVMTECGHGYKSLLHDAARWLGRPLPFRVKVITDLAAEAVAAGRLQIDPTQNPGLHTYHDPCNMSRKADLLEPPRRLLDACVERWVEMTPHGRWNYCCGGGGGADHVPGTQEVRHTVGRLKADQIRRTGAEVVATGCLSCWSTLGDIAKQNALDVEVRTLGLIVSRALVR